MHTAEKINQGIILGLLSIVVSILITACAATKDRSNRQLVIQQQGSYAIGGSVITNPGTFDPIKDGAFNPARIQINLA